MSDDTENAQRAIRDRIARFMHTDEQLRPKEVSQEEAQTLRAASGRLERLLKKFTEAEETQRQQDREKEAEALRAAARRLDSLLAGVTGKATMPELKLRRLKTDETP